MFGHKMTWKMCKTNQIDLSSFWFRDLFISHEESNICVEHEIYKLMTSPSSCRWLNSIWLLLQFIYNIFINKSQIAHCIDVLFSIHNIFLPLNSPVHYSRRMDFVSMKNCNRSHTILGIFHFAKYLIGGHKVCWVLPTNTCMYLPTNTFITMSCVVCCWWN